MQKYPTGGMRAICVYKDEEVSESFEKCENFRKFIGWGYRCN